MKLLQKFSLIIIFSMILIFQIIYDVDAFSQTGTNAIVKIQPGESYVYRWGLNSDLDVPVTITLSATGDGADYLSFPESIQLAPGEWVPVDVLVEIPNDNPNDVYITADVFATLKGTGEGSTVFNLQMQKPFEIYIGNPVIERAGTQEKTATEMNDEKLQKLQEENQRLQEQLEEQKKVQEKEAQPQPTATTESNEGGGCLISTATYGSELAPQIQMLREIRDNSLLSTSSGTTFMTGFNTLYYSFSPTIADLERQSPIFQEAVKLTITPLLTSLTLLNYVDMNSEEQVLGYGIGIILLNIGMYFVAPTAIIIRLRR